MIDPTGLPKGWAPASHSAVGTIHCGQSPSASLIREMKSTKDFLKLRTSEPDKVRFRQKDFDTLGAPFSVVVSTD